VAPLSRHEPAGVEAADRQGCLRHAEPRRPQCFNNSILMLEHLPTS
jgi:hypothetical protein